MADDVNKRIAELQQQRELMQWMIDNQKRVNNGVAAHLKARKQLFEYTQMLQEAEAQFAESSKIIQDIEEDRIKISKEEERQLRKLNADQEKKIDLIRRELQLQKKTLSIRKTLVKEVEKGVNYIMKEVFALRKLTNLYLEIDKSVRQTSVSIGLTAGAAEDFRANMLGAADDLARFNVSIADVARIQKAITSATGTALLLSEKEMKRLGVISKLLPEIGDFVQQLELLGFGAGESADEFSKIFNEAQQYGLDAEKFTKNMNKNLKLMTKYRFRGGIQDLKTATRLTQRMRQDMEQFTGFAEKVMRPEGAIEAAASLQVLGGEMGRLGDPFMLMSRARNDMAGFTEEVMNATKFVGVFNQRTGRFELTANELDRLRELSKITGQSFDDLTAQALEQASDARIRATISPVINPADRDFLSSITDTKDGKLVVELRGGPKDLSKITQEDVEYLKAEQATMEQMVKAQMTFKDNFDAIVKMLQLTLLPIMEDVGQFLKGVTDKLADTSDGYKKAFAYGVLALGAIFGLGAMFAGGVSMGLGFRSASGIGRLSTFGGMKGTMAGGASGAQMLGAGKAQRAKLMGTAAVIASIGVALAGVGAGVYFAASGFAKLAESIKDLDTEKLAFMKNIMLGIGIAIGGIIAVMTGLALSGVGQMAALVMLGFGSSLLMIGTGVGIATAGISLLIDSLTGLIEIDTTKLPSGFALMELAGGLTALSAAALFALPGLMVLGSLAGMGEGLTMAADGVEKLADNMSRLSSNLQEVRAGDGIQNLQETIGALNKVMLETQSTPIRVEVGGRVDGSVDVSVEGSEFRKDLLRDSNFLEDLTEKIEQRVMLRNNITGNS